MLDVVGLQGVFLGYPQIASSGRSMVAAGLLYQMLKRKPHFPKWQNWEDVPEKQRERLLLRTMQKLEQLDEDEAFIVLVA